MRNSATQSRPVPRSQFARVVGRASDGDRDAWSSLYDLVNPGLHRYLTASAGRARGEEILAETFLELGSTLSSFRGGASEFRVMAFATARRRMSDRSRFDPGRPGSVNEEAAYAAPEPTTMFASSVALALSPRQAEAVLICVCGRLLIAEAAQVLGQPAESVARLAQDGLCQLDDFLTAQAALREDAAGAPLETIDLETGKGGRTS